jgi:hypothetical protein
MVIVVGRERGVIVDAGVDATPLARVLQVLERRLIPISSSARIWIVHFRPAHTTSDEVVGHEVPEFAAPLGAGQASDVKQWLQSALRHARRVASSNWQLFHCAEGSSAPGEVKKI